MAPTGEGIDEEPGARSERLMIRSGISRCKKNNRERFERELIMIGTIENQSNNSPGQFSTSQPIFLDPERKSLLVEEEDY